MARALDAARAGAQRESARHADIADQILCGLERADVDQLRDFIAGLANASDARLRVD
ncbi:hypothetical protein H5V45_09275 [Nocardioides sp. KIGAM211]|uniref:Uncharacterized protein n=1 Tax=Nocardioides luti TaxID=2761101 RepID=A0A7X0RFT7_9ACTN|nr:hypothetical protein [Nocardioides luti]MBB6627513.1 hypothetical protein [Nocardioides luti]